MDTKIFNELTDRDLFASLIFLGYVLRAGQVTDMKETRTCRVLL